MHEGNELTSRETEAGETMKDEPPEPTVAQAPTAEKEPPRTACVCEGGRLRAAVRDDLDRYVFIAQEQLGKTGRLLPLRTGLMSKGLWATAAYRWNHYAQHRVHSRLLGVLPGALHRAIIALTGIHIDAGAHIGPGLAFAHGGPAVIGPVRVGRNCDIYHGVTFGASMSLDDRNPRPGAPTLGDRVWVGPGAVLAGDVTVGDDAAVVRDVPPRGVVIGVPARVVSRRGSFAQVIYRGMDTDDERKAALAADPDAGPAQAG
jgi:serine O-acetyltransferase